MIKRKLIIAALTTAVAFTACKKGPKEDPETDPFKLEYSNLTTEQHKQELESAGMDFIGKIEGLPNEKFIDILDYLVQLEPEMGDGSNSFSSVFVANAAAKNKDLNSLFKAVTVQQTTTDEKIALSELYAIYTWNSQDEEWVKTSSDDRLEFRFPGSGSSTSNNAILTCTYVKSSVEKSIDNETVELPASVSVILTVDDKEELKLSSSYEYQADGTPTKTDISLMLGSYTLKINVKNEVSIVTAGMSIEKGTEKLMSLSSTGKGNMAVETIEDEDYESIVNEANATFEIMNFQLVGVVDYKSISAEEKKWDNLSEQEYSTKEAETWNKYSKFVALNKTSNTVIAKNEFVSAEDSYESCNWDGQCNTYTDYYLEPRLVFKDDSKISYDSFFETGFSQLIDEFENFAEGFE